MAVATATLAADNNTNANWVAWTGFIRSCFQAAWVQTADTGQTNPASLGTNPALGASVYEVYRMNDSLQSSCPCYVRLDYGVGTSSANNITLKITMGLGSNGAGTITGTTQSFNMFGTGGSSGSVGTTYICRASYDTNRMTLAMWYPLNANPSFLLNIERSKDGTGADTSEFLSYMITNYAGAQGHYSAWLTKAGQSGGRSYHECVYNIDAGTAISQVVGIFPTQHVVGSPRFPQLGTCAGRTNDWVLNDTPSISFYPGVSHTYFCLKGFFQYMWPGSATSSGNSVVFMRWD